MSNQCGDSIGRFGSAAGKRNAAKEAEAKRVADEEAAERARVETGIPMQYQQKGYKPVFGQFKPQGAYQYQGQYQQPDVNKTLSNIRQSYAPMAQNIIDQSKNMMRSGSQQAQNVAGQRGLGRGGVAQMGQNQALEAGVQNQQNMMANLGMQQQQALTQAQQQADQMQQGQYQFGAQQGAQNWQFAQQQQQQQYQLDNQLAQADRQMQMQEWLTGRQVDSAEREARRQEIIQQFNIDQTMRQSQLAEEMLPLDYLLKLYGANAGQQWSEQTGGSPGVFGTIGALGGAASSVMSGIGALAALTPCLPKGAMLKLEDGGEIAVELVQIGDNLKGGRVLKVSKVERPKDQKFWMHKFNTGDVVMTLGHPYFDELISKEPVENDSEHDYDVLTEKGYYYVGNVKLGSSLKE